MRFILLLLLWQGVSCWGTLSVRVNAEEILQPDTAIVPSEPLFKRMTRFFNTPDDVKHAGLLGKYYFQSLAQQLDIDDPYVRTFEPTWDGHDTFVNLPAISPHTSFPIGVDFFIGYSSIGINKVEPGHVVDSQSFNSYYRYERTLNARTESLTLGTTIFLDRGGRFRPYVQLGTALTRARMASIGGDAYGYHNFNYFSNEANNLEHTYINREMRLLFNTGFEYDINSVLAYRMTLITETKGRFSDSLLSQDLIVWPVKRFFLRFGVASDFDGQHAMSNIGGGFAF